MNSYIILSSSKSSEFHVTVAPRFFIEDSSVEAFITDLTLIMNGRKKVSVVGLEEKEFTTKSNENVQVLTLDKEENLMSFHYDILNLTNKYSDIVFAFTDHIGERFQPHITGATLENNIPEFDIIEFSQEVSPNEFRRILISNLE